jgi:hypothetical protein
MADSQDFHHPWSSAPDASASHGTEQAASPFADIVAYFEREHKGRFLMNPDKRIIHWVLSGDNGTYTLLVRWDAKAQQLLIRVPHITTVPKDKLVAAAVLCNLINWHLTSGTFQVDFADGELVFRNNLTVQDGSLGQEQLKSSFRHSAVTVDQFLPAFYWLFWSDASPEEILAALQDCDPAAVASDATAISHSQNKKEEGTW